MSLPHSPIPWSFKDGFKLVVGDAKDPEGTPFAEIVGDPAMQFGNASFICRAVNNHDKLKTELRCLIDDLSEVHVDELISNHNGDGPDGCSYCRNIASAKAALSEASKV